MTRAVILSAVRTPVGRYGGALAGVRPDDLAALAVRAAVDRAGVPEAEIEDVWLGCANQAGEDNRDVARMAVLLAGLARDGRRRDGQPALRVGPRRNRRRLPRGDRRGRRPVRRGRRRVDDACAARHRQARRCVPARRPDAVRHDARLAVPQPAARGAVPARDDGRDRRERRRALGRCRGPTRTRSRSARSSGGLPRRRRAASTTSSCRSATLARDEHPRPDTTAEKLAGLRAAFREGGTVTAGNSSGINDGAAALVVASEEKARELGVAAARRRSPARPSRASIRASWGSGRCPRCASCSRAPASRSPTSTSSS